MDIFSNKYRKRAKTMYVFLIVEKAIIIFYESNQGKKEITDTKDYANKMKSDI